MPRKWRNVDHCVLGSTLQAWVDRGCVLADHINLLTERMCTDEQERTLAQIALRPDTMEQLARDISLTRPARFGKRVILREPSKI
jgi:hypothetical protein